MNIKSTLAISAVAIFSSSVLSAAPPLSKQQLLRMIKENRQQKQLMKTGCPSLNVIPYETSQSEFIIPTAGNAQGGGGTFFRTDLTLVNYEVDDVDVVVRWLQAGVDGTNGPTAELTLTGESSQTFIDFVGTELQRTGLGALHVYAVDADGDPDDSVYIDGYSRIWTPQPGSAGSVSQSFEPLAIDHTIGDFAAVSLGLRHDSAFRTNAGIANLYSTALTWDVYAIGDRAERQFTITVPARSLNQVSLRAVAEANYGPVILFFVPRDFTEDAAENATWAAFASSTDNVTGDGWVARAAQ